MKTSHKPAVLLANRFQAFLNKDALVFFTCLLLHALIFALVIAVSINNASAAPPVKLRKDACETIKTTPFDANIVTPVRAKRGFVTQIILGAGEFIIDKRGGDSDGWEVSSIPNQPILTVKARSTANNSNLIVTTNQRVYVMSLLILPDSSGCNGNWQLVFVIPQPPALAVIVDTPEMIAIKSANKLKEALKAVPDMGNFSYSMQVLSGSDDIIPDEVYDDGRFTFMRFAGNRELPSIFRISADGEEVITDRHMQGRDIIVAHEVARRWVLRLNKQTVGIWNDAFDPVGVPPVAGTTSEKVERITNGKEYGDE